MDIREQLKIRRETLSTLETDSPVTQEMIDDAFVLANFSRRSSDQSKYSQLRRLFEYQKDAEEAKNSQPQPEVEPVTKEQVSEAAKKAKESPTIENLAAHSKLKRSYTAQEEEKEAERLAKMPKHDPVAEAEAAKAAEEASRVEYAEFLGNQRRKTIDAKVRTALGLNR